MQRIIVTLGLALALAACGADGEPITPSVNTSLSVGSGGVSTSTSIGVSRGPVSIGITL